VKRFSLPNVCKHELLDVDGLFRLPRVSCAAASADDADLDPNIAGETLTLSKNKQEIKTIF
jgi:inositol-1,3,4-trisphosphate 5/6-kinase/inositol-tetrakisphosphate 1-kinase